MFLFGLYQQCRHTNYIENTQSIIAQTSLLDDCAGGLQVVQLLDGSNQAKYKQLDSGKCWSVDTSAFKAEACELANLLACVSQLCQKLNLPIPKELYRPTVFKP